MSQALARQTRPYSRQGISIVEFVGCLVALGGGVVLGSMYLGVDLQGLAVSTLEKADIQIPAILTQQSNSDNSAAANPQTLSADIAKTAQAQSRDGEVDDRGVAEGPTLILTDNAVAENFGEGRVTDNANQVATSVAEPELTDAEQRAATKAAWNVLTTAMKTEIDSRSKVKLEAGNWQLFDYLLLRKNGHEAAVEAIDQIDLNGVDQRLKTHISRVLAWHRLGTTLFERATQLLTDAPTGQLTGPFAQSWQSSSTQHRMEEQLLLKKHRSVKGYLEHKLKPNADTADSESTK